jgi:hypothetical protein
MDTVLNAKVTLCLKVDFVPPDLDPDCAQSICRKRLDRPGDLRNLNIFEHGADTPGQDGRGHGFADAPGLEPM